MFTDCMIISQYNNLYKQVAGNNYMYILMRHYSLCSARELFIDKHVRLACIHKSSVAGKNDKCH